MAVTLGYECGDPRSTFDEDRKMGMGTFKREGFLQEVNRLFFHPRGLSLWCDKEGLKIEDHRGKAEPSFADLSDPKVVELAAAVEEAMIYPVQEVGAAEAVPDGA